MVTRDLFTIANLLDSIFKVGKSSWLMMLPGVDQLQQFHHQHTTGAVRDSQTCSLPSEFFEFSSRFRGLLCPRPYAHSYWKQGALGAAGVMDGLQLGRSVRCTTGGGILCRHAHSLLTVKNVTELRCTSFYFVLLTVKCS